MSRFAHSITAVTFFLSAFAAGCSSTNQASDPNERPAGCKVNECDVAYDHCKATHAPPPDRCQECNDTCNNVGYDSVVSCLETCERICSTPSTPDMTCENERTTCQSTPHNASCVDALASTDVPGAPMMTFSWKPPAAPHSGACSDAQLARFKAACIGTGTDATCQAFGKAAPACSQCLYSEASADTWGPLVGFQLGPDQGGKDVLVTNDVGCIATIEGDTSANGCGAKLFARDSCLSECSSLSDPSACQAFVSAHECKSVVDAAAECSKKLGLDTPGSAYDACMLEKSDVDSTIALSRFFCGAP